MADKTMPPDWAIERALTRFPRPFYYDGTPWTVDHIKERQTTEYGISVRFMASQIEEHEEPPVGPLLIEAGDIIQNWRNGNAGEDDAVDTARLVLAALRRGIEIAKGGEA